MQQRHQHQETDGWWIWGDARRSLPAGNWEIETRWQMELPFSWRTLWRKPEIVEGRYKTGYIVHVPSSHQGVNINVEK